MGVKRLFILLQALLPLTLLLPVAVARADYKPVAINQEVRDGGLQYSALAAITDYPVPSYEDLPPQGMYLQILGKVTNVGNTPQVYNASYQTLTDKRGRVYAPSLAKIAQSSKTMIAINPGNQAVAPLYFDIPPGTSPSDYWFTLRSSSPAATGASIWLCSPKNDTCGE